MQVDIATQHLEINPEIKDFIEEKCTKLKRHLTHFDAELLHLKVALERNPHREQYLARLNLILPQTSLNCREKSADLFTATKFAFESLIRRVEKLKSKTSGDYLTKRKLKHFKRK